MGADRGACERVHQKTPCYLRGLDPLNTWALPGKIVRPLMEGMDHFEVSKIKTLLKILS